MITKNMVIWFRFNQISEVFIAPLIMAIIKGITSINSSNSNGSSPAQGIGDMVSRIASSVQEDNKKKDRVGNTGSDTSR